MRALVLLLALSSIASAQGPDLGELDAGPVAVEPDPDAPTVGAALDKPEAYVGDRLALTVTAIARGGIVVNLPQKLELGPVELLERDDSDAKGRDLGDGRRSFRFILYVAAYDVGPAEVPPLGLTYADARGEVRTVSTAPVAFTIHALVDEATKAPDPQPARSPRSALIEDRRVTRAAWIVSGGLMILAAIFLLRRLWKKKRAATIEARPVAPARPAGEIAIERLNAIRARGDFSRDGYRPFAFDTAEVVRAYLGARYGFDSLELTSTELLAELERTAPHLAQRGSEVVRFIEQTDFIKFAKAGSSDAEAIALLDAAQSIVLSTAPKLEAAETMLTGAVRPPAPLDGDE